MQLTLAFASLPQPQDSVWEQLDEPLREMAMERLAKLLAKVAVAQLQAKDNNDD